MSSRRPISTYLAMSSDTSPRARRGRRIVAVEASIRRREERARGPATSAGPRTSHSVRAGLDGLAEHELAALGDVGAVGGQGRVAVLVDAVGAQHRLLVLGCEEGVDRLLAVTAALLDRVEH